MPHLGVFFIYSSRKYYGEIYFYDHESSNANKIKTLIKIADSLDSFINALISEEDYELRLAKTDPELYARLQYAKAHPQI